MRMLNLLPAELNFIGRPPAPKKADDKSPKGAAAEPEADFPKGPRSDGHTDYADEDIIQRVLKEPEANDGHIVVAVRVSLVSFCPIAVPTPSSHM